MSTVISLPRNVRKSFIERVDEHPAEHPAELPAEHPVSFRWPMGLIVALFVALSFHGGLLISGTYRGTFDAYVHLFFADHYRRSWFSSFEPRWYTGFSVLSYPPGTHQVLALVAKVVGLEFSFVLVALLSVLLSVVGMYRFARLWGSDDAAGYAALFMALSSSLAESLHIFGQLPTLFALGFLLNGLPFVYRWIRHGTSGSFVIAICAAAATTAAHHVTTIFGSVFFVGPVVVRAILDSKENGGGRSMPATLGHRGVGAATVRAGAYGVALLVSVVVVILPYWLWTAAHPIRQVAIPHASRDNFLVNRNAGLVFFVIPWGSLGLVFLQSLRRGFRSRRWPLSASVLLAAVLGTGGTSPIPKLLLGGAFDILTLDRFSLWASFLILPLVGQWAERAIALFRAKGKSPFGVFNLFARTQAVFGIAVLLLTMIVAVLTANLSRFRPMQPTAVDPAPIVRFMGKEQHDRWRYLTLGFGDQMAWLSAQMTAQSVDGNYHSARRLPELTTTPVERLEAAKYKGVAGLGSLQQVLAYPDKFHLKFVFSNDHYYDPLLDASGWQRIDPLNNGIAVWVREDVTAIPTLEHSNESPLWQRLIWGLLPISSIMSAFIVFGAHAIGFRPSVKWFRFLHVARPPVTLQQRGLVMVEIVGRAVTLAIDVGMNSAAFGMRMLTPLVLLRGRRAQIRPSRSKTLYAFGAISVVLVVGVGSTMLHRAPRRNPPKTLYAYYEALDQRNIDAAYGLLSEGSRPSLAQFTRERALSNGLVASYAQLLNVSNVRTEYDEQDSARAEVSGLLNYVTSFSSFSVPVRHRLRLGDGGWTIDAPEVDLSIPPEQLVVRPVVSYFDQGRRSVFALATADADILDRPDLHVLSAHLVRVDGEFSVVGEVLNVDVVPSRLTVTVSLLRQDGSILSRTSNGMTSAHSALPGERVPFRVDFVGVSSTTTDPKYPDAKVRAIVPSDIGEVQVAVSTVSAHTDLDRPVMIDGASRSGRNTVSLIYRNDGLEEVTVPHVLFTLRRVDGSVGWVQSEFLSRAIRPQRTQTESHSIVDAYTVTNIDVPVVIFSNGRSGPTRSNAPAFLPAVSGWSGVDVSTFGFTKSPG
jgi:hypothetical protein